jgi:hypothetical protein
LWRGTGREVFLGLRVGELIDLAETIGRSGWPETAPQILPAGEG